MNVVTGCRVSDIFLKKLECIKFGNLLSILDGKMHLSYVKMLLGADNMKA